MSNFIDRLLRRKNTLNAPEDAPDGSERLDIEEVLDKLLQHAQATHIEKMVDEDGNLRIKFLYQAGNFQFYYRKGTREVAIHFLFFDELPLTALENVRSFCNAFNQHFMVIMAHYSYNDEENALCLHLSTHLNLSAWNRGLQMNFVNMLQLCFLGARDLRSKMESLRKAKTDEDVESNSFVSRREAVLQTEAEMAINPLSIRSHGNDHITIGRIMETAYGEGSFEMQNVHITSSTDTGTILTKNCGDCDLAAIDITEILFDDSRAMTWNHVDLFIVVRGIYRENITDCIIHFTLADLDETVTYFHVNAIMEPHVPGADCLQVSWAPEHFRSFLMAYSLNDDEEKMRQEFEYHWAEAKDRKAKGERLTEDEEFFMQMPDRDIVNDLYWGQQYYLDKNYTQAIVRLENAYNRMLPDVHKIPKDKKHHFFNLCYFLGRCYLNIGQPKLAYYYLDGLFNLNNIRYTTAYITAIVRCHDYRAPKIVNDVLANIRRILNEQPEMPDDNREDLTRFLLFLRRQKARLCIDMEQYDEAEKILRQLLDDDPNHEQFILEHLAQVTTRRAAQEAERIDKSTLSVSSDFPSDHTDDAAEAED